jgi:hypothetical protein
MSEADCEYDGDTYTESQISRTPTALKPRTSMGSSVSDKSRAHVQRMTTKIVLWNWPDKGKMSNRREVIEKVRAVVQAFTMVGGLREFPEPGVQERHRRLPANRTSAVQWNKDRNDKSSASESSTSRDAKDLESSIL